MTDDPDMLTETAGDSLRRDACPICGSRDLESFLTLRDLPAQIGVIWPDRSSARQAPRGDVILAFCHGCSFVFNAVFDATKLAYQPGYEYSLHYSPSHSEFLDATVDRLIEQYSLRGKSIIEVGCGSGHFLKLLCERGGNQGFGFDPAVQVEQTVPAAEGQVTLIRDFYDERHQNVPCDLLCCRSMFELIEDPREFLVGIRNVLGERTDARIYLDIPNTSYVFRNRALWNIFWEQCNYFTEQTLADVFRRSGFDVLQSAECLGDGYYIFVEAAPAGTSSSSQHEPAQYQLPQELLELAPYYQSQLGLWHDRFENWKADRKRVIAWGSGGRGINFLSATDSNGLIDSVVDINPQRQGGYISGGGQEVIAPEALIEEQPDMIVITNSLYGPEIRQQVKSLGLQCDFAEL